MIICNIHTIHKNHSYNNNRTTRTYSISSGVPKCFVLNSSLFSEMPSAYPDGISFVQMDRNLVGGAYT